MSSSDTLETYFDNRRDLIEKGTLPVQLMQVGDSFMVEPGCGFAGAEKVQMLALWQMLQKAAPDTDIGNGQRIRKLDRLGYTNRWKQGLAVVVTVDPSRSIVWAVYRFEDDFILIKNEYA